MLFVIRRNWTEWVEAFSTLAEAQTRFDALKAEQPDWNLQILSEGEHTGVVYPSDVSLHEDKPEQGKVYSLFGGRVSRVSLKAIVGQSPKSKIRA